jgi:uncharacterized membrane protein YeaQ/YmgE (transglycosylase-associated protein family)
MHAVMILLFGLIGGTLARLVILRGRPGWWIPSAVLGIAGALCSGFLARSAGLYQEWEGGALAVWLLGAIFVSTIYDAAVLRRLAT